jgi:hypothetical protein
MSYFSSTILAENTKTIQKEGGFGQSSIKMSGGYFFGDAYTETHVHGPQGVAVMVGDIGTQGPFNKATEARMSAEGRVSNTLFDGSTDKARLAAIKAHGPSSNEALRYTPATLSERDIVSSAASVDASKSMRATVAGVSTDRGIDPLTSFRALASDGTIRKDDIRQLAAAYTHPNEDMRLPMPKSMKQVDEVHLEREEAVTLAAIRKLERSGAKNRAAEAYEDLGVKLAKAKNISSAMPFLIKSCDLAREHTREHGRDVRPMRRMSEVDAR